MKILYTSQLSPNDTSQYRAWALERLGHSVTSLNLEDYVSSNRLIRAAVHRLVVGPGVQRLNRDLIQLAESVRPDIFWADKALWVEPETLDHLRSL